MKKIYLSIAIGVLALAVTAQQYVHQVIFLNEGKYDYMNNIQVIPVSLGTYNPLTKIYTETATIPNVRFGSDVIFDENSFYVAADTLLLKYNRYTMQLESSKTVTGIRKLAIWNDKILVTRGDIMPLNSYFQVYDKNTLAFIYELGSSIGPAYASEGIGLIGDTAYIAIGNGFDYLNEVGFIGMVDLNSQTYKGEIDLGPNGKNPDNMMVDGNMIYTLNNKDWTGSSITLINTDTKDTTTMAVAGGGGCGSSALAINHIFYMEYSVGKVARFNVNSMTIVDTLENTLPFYGMVTDEINSIFYATTTDYSSSGKAYIMQFNGMLTDSFDVGVSAGTIALDIRTLVGVNEFSSSALRTQFLPNPTNGIFEIGNLTSETGSIRIHNILGEKIYQAELTKLSRSTKIDISAQPSGIYFVTVKTEHGMHTEKLVKQ